MRLYARIVNPEVPIEMWIREAKHALNTRYEGDLIDWSTMHYDVGETTFEGQTLTLFTLTVESAGSMALTFGDSA